MLNLPNRKSNTILNEIDMAIQSANTILTNNINDIDNRVTSLELGGGGGGAVVVDIQNNITALQADTVAIQTVNSIQNIDIAANTTAITAIQSVNTNQNIYINTINDEITTINESITEIDDGMTDILSRVTTLEGATLPVGGDSGGSDYISPADYETYSLKQNTILYMDFSDSEDLMRDFSKNTAKPKNNGCSYESDLINGDSNTTRKYSLRVDSCNKQWYSASNVGNLGIGGVPGTIPASGSGNYTNNKWFSNYTGLDLSQYAPLLKVPKITLSIWFKIDADMLSGTRLNLFSMGEGTSTGFTFHANAIVGTGCFFDLYQGATPLLRTMAGHNVSGPERNLGRIGWNHMVFTMDETGNKVFTNGAYVDTTILGWNHAAGTKDTYIDLSTKNIKYFHLGTWARLEGDVEVYDAKGNVSNMTHSRVFWGNIGDILILDRKITDAEALGLYNDEYGYDLLMFAGQSNMVGSLESPIGPEESDFTGLEEVLKYNIPSNISNYGTGSALIDTPVFANNIYNLVSSLGPFRGLWMNFTREYMKIEKRPYKRKVLIVQVAYGNRGFYGASNAWHPTTGFLTKCLIGACQQVITDHPFSEVVSFCWNQGETDIVNQSPSYEADFNSFITQLNTIPTFENKPIILAKISSNEYAHYVNGSGKKMINIVNDAMVEICNNIPNRRLVETSSLTYIAGDLWHYDTNALRKLGLLYFAQYADILKTNQNSVANFIEPIAFKPSLQYNNLAIDEYVSFNFNATTSGTAVLTNQYFLLTRLGRTVNIQLQTDIDFRALSSTALLNFTAIPIEFRPSVDLHFMIYGNPKYNVPTQTEFKPQLFIINTNGTMSIGDIGDNKFWVVNDDVKIMPFSITYQI